MTVREENNSFNMRKGTIYIVFSLFIILSCSRKNNNISDNNSKELKKDQLAKVNKEYQKSLSFYRDNFIDHFPKELDSNYITYTESVSAEAGLIRLDLIYKHTGKNNFEKKAIAKYASTDTCLLIANRFANNDNYSYNIVLNHDDSLKIDRECYKNKYPIPNFWHTDYTTNKTACKLPKGFNIYVLNAMAGRFLENKNLTDGRYMPENWQHGYSKGVAINEAKDTIIYWIIIW